MNIKTIIFGFLLLMVSTIAGLFAVVYSSLTDGKISLLLALPMALAFGIFLLLDKKKVLILILFFRASADIVFANASFGSFSVGAVVNLLIMVIAAMYIIENVGGLTKRIVSIWGPVLLISVFAVAYSPAMGEALRMLNAMLTYFSVFLLAFYLIKNKSDYEYYLNLIIFSSILPVLYAFVDVALNLGAFAGGEYRLKSTFGHPNIFAFYLVLVVSLVFYKIKSPTIRLRQPVKISMFIYMAVLGCLLLLTQTRSAWAAALVTFAVYGLFFERRYIVYLALAGFVAMLIPNIRSRVIDLDSGNDYVLYAKLNSYAWRKLIWESGIGWMEPLRYFFGYGLESFKYYSTIFFPLAGATQWGAHSVFVQWFFETGIFGMLASSWMYLKMTLTIKSGLHEDKVRTLITLLVIAGYLMESYSDNMLSYLSYNWYFWFFMGASCALVIAQQKEKQLQDENGIEETLLNSEYIKHPAYSYHKLAK